MNMHVRFSGFSSGACLVAHSIGEQLVLHHQLVYTSWLFGICPSPSSAGICRLCEGILFDTLNAIMQRQLQPPHVATNF